MFLATGVSFVLAEGPEKRMLQFYHFIFETYLRA